MKPLDPKLKWNFDFDEEIPHLDIKISEPKKEDKKTKIEIFKSKKNGKRDSSTNTELF
jgi:hypothetical protein